MIRTSIVIPLYGGLRLTRECDAALRATLADRDDVEVVYVDNASPDDTRSWLEALPADAATRVLLDENENFAGGCNRGVAAASGANIVLLNNDTVPLNGWLEPLERLLEDASIGIVGCLLLYPSGTVQHAGVTFPPLKMPIHAHVGVAADDTRVLQRRDLQAVTAACMAVRRDVWSALNGLDERYANGMEDIDLCLRARARGYRVVYEPASRVVHHESSSTGRFTYAVENSSRFLGEHAQQYVPDAHWFDALVGVADKRILATRAEAQDGIDNQQLCDALGEGTRVELRAGGVYLSADAVLVERIGGVDPHLERGAALCDWLDRAKLAGAHVESSGAFDAARPWLSAHVPELRKRWGVCAPIERTIAEPVPFLDAVQSDDLTIDVERHARAVLLTAASGELAASALRALDAYAGTAEDITLLVRVEPGDEAAFAALDAAAEQFDNDDELPDIAVVEAGAHSEVALAATCDGVLVVGSAAQRARQRSIARAAGVDAVASEVRLSDQRS